MKSTIAATWQRYRTQLISLLILAWITILIYGLAINPSAKESHEKFQVMKSEMSALIANGGKIVDSYENAKYGNASLSKTISYEGWSDELLRKYRATLIQNGWLPIKTEQDAYCKLGILTKISLHAGIVNGVGANSLSMRYDPATIRACGETKATSGS